MHTTPREGLDLQRHKKNQEEDSPRPRAMAGHHAFRSPSDICQKINDVNKWRKAPSLSFNQGPRPGLTQADDPGLCHPAPPLHLLLATLVGLPQPQASNGKGGTQLDGRGSEEPSLGIWR